MNEFQIDNPADCMAYLLIFVSGSDGELSGHEGTATMKILTEFINHFEIDIDKDGAVDNKDAVACFTRTLNLYESLPEKEAAMLMVNSADTIKKNVDKDNLPIIIKNLRALSAVDQTVSKSEKEVVDIIEEIFMMSDN